MKCLKCAIKINIKEKEVNRPHICIDCANGITPCKCDDCDETLVYCTVMRYAHDGNTPNDCMWFKNKNEVKDNE